MQFITKSFANRARSLTRRSFFGTAAGLALPALAVASTVPAHPAIPPELAALATSYAASEAKAESTGDDDDLDARDASEARMLESMRTHGVKAFVHAGRIVVDSFSLAGDRGGLCLDLAAVRGL